MSLLDDARRLAQHFDPHYKHHDGVSRCYFCRADIVEPTVHASDCPWLMLPQIVAALEAVYGLMQSEDGAEPIEGDVWAFCGQPASGPHWEGCLWVKLRDLVYRDSAP